MLSGSTPEGYFESRGAASRMKGARGKGRATQLRDILGTKDLPHGTI